MTAVASIECVGSTVLVDPPPAPAAERAVCPACGQTVPVGGWPKRYLVHREPGEPYPESFPATVRGLGAS